MSEDNIKSEFLVPNKLLLINGSVGKDAMQEMQETQV